MTIKIGKASYGTRRPKDLDEQVLASTGLSAAEVASHLKGSPMRGFVMRALKPFLADEDAAAVQDSVVTMDSAAFAAMLREVQGLYAKDEPEEAEPGAIKKTGAAAPELPKAKDKDA